MLWDGVMLGELKHKTALVQKYKVIQKEEEEERQSRNGKKKSQSKKAGSLYVIAIRMKKRSYGAKKNSLVSNLSLFHPLKAPHLYSLNNMARSKFTLLKS